MTPKKLSQKYLKRAGEIKVLKTALRMDISLDSENEKILRRITEKSDLLH